MCYTRVCQGPLFDELLSSTIKVDNDAVLVVATSRRSNGVPKPTKRGPRVTLTGVKQAEVERFAFLHGNKFAICLYSKEYSSEIKDSSVSIWKSKYGRRLWLQMRGWAVWEKQRCCLRPFFESTRLLSEWRTTLVLSITATAYRSHWY